MNTDNVYNGFGCVVPGSGTVSKKLERRSLN